MPRPPSSRPHDAEAGREPPSHASGLAPSALIHAYTRRLLEPIGYVPPAEYEARYYEQAAVA